MLLRPPTTPSVYLLLILLYTYIRYLHPQVDRHVRALDITIAEQQTTLSLDVRDTPSLPHPNLPPESGQIPPSDEPVITLETVDTGLLSSNKNRRHYPPLSRRTRQQAKTDENGNDMQTNDPIAGRALDIPIDPYEPRYCYCKRVAFGDVSLL